MISSLQKKYAIAVQRSLEDPVFHRTTFFKDGYLFAPHVEIVNLIEKHIKLRSGKVITIRVTRQFGKNEMSAWIHARAALRYQNNDESIVRVAPTYKPQIVNSKLRVTKQFHQDMLLNGKLLKTIEGFIFQYRGLMIFFLSADPDANVEGATATLLLDIDEAHKTDTNIIEERFMPMTAFKSAPTVMWGVAALKDDILYDYFQYNKENEPELALEFPAKLCCELSPAYARHYEERVKKLGATHPVILQQYDLIDGDAEGGYLKSPHITSLFDSVHTHQYEPKSNARYIMLIDIAGENEENVDSIEDVLKNDGQSKGKRDSTIAWIIEVDAKDRKYNYPLYRIVQGHWWTGKQLAAGPSGIPGQQEILLNLCFKWKPMKVIVDARGVGEQVAMYLKKRYPKTVPYKASANTVSQDCYGLLALINNDRVKMWRNDADPKWVELMKQSKHTQYEIRLGDLMRIIKPSSWQHIDMIKALTYLGGQIRHQQMVSLSTKRGRLM